MYFVYVVKDSTSDYYDDEKTIPIAVFTTKHNLIEFANSLSTDRSKRSTRYNTGTWIGEYWYIKIKPNKPLDLDEDCDGRCIKTIVI